MSATIHKGNSRNSGYARVEHQWYTEQPDAVRALLKVERFSGGIHDPACGGGNIPTVCRDAGLYATGADIVDRGAGEVRDFLTDDRHYDNIICNPPFTHAVTFTTRGLKSLTTSSGKVCILQRLAWLEGQARRWTLFQRGFLHRVWVFSGRISMPPGGTDVPAKGGSVAYAWFVFGMERRETTLGWLP